MASTILTTPPKTLDELRSKVSDADRDILSFCWAYYRTDGRHPKIRDVYFKFEKPTVDAAAKRLTGNLVRRTWSSSTPGEDYQITHLGALSSADGTRLTDLLHTYLQALKLLYDENHDIRGINSTDLKPYADRTSNGPLSDEGFRDLGRLLVLGVRFLDTSAVGPNPDGTWYVNIGENIDDIRRVPDFRNFLQQELVKAFDPGDPVTEIERANRQLQYNRLPLSPPHIFQADDLSSMEGSTAEARSPLARLVESMKNHPVVSFVLLMLPVAGGSLGIANLWYSSVISEYRQQVEELSSELTKLRQQFADMKKETQDAGKKGPK